MNKVNKLEKQLMILARDFRGDRDENKRAEVAKKYAEVVDKLIATGKWRIPVMEDQLTDEWMPEAFFTHWNLTVPPDLKEKQC